MPQMHTLCALITFPLEKHIRSISSERISIERSDARLSPGRTSESDREIATKG